MIGSPPWDETGGYVLDLDLSWIVTPGDRVICRRVESDRAREAASRKRMRELRKARAVFV